MEKLTFGGPNPQTELFWWDGSFWILDGSSKLWCFEWNGILSFPQVWHAERITHVSILKTSTKKVINWNGINSQLNGVNFQPNGVSYFGCFQCIFELLDATYLPMFPRVFEYQKVRKMQEWQLTRQESRQTVETDFFGRDGRNYWSDNNCFSRGWRKKNYPAGRPRYIYIDIINLGFRFTKFFRFFWLARAYQHLSYQQPQYSKADLSLIILSAWNWGYVASTRQYNIKHVSLHKL